MGYAARPRAPAPTGPAARRRRAGFTVPEDVVAAIERRWPWVLGGMMLVEAIVLLYMGRGLTFYFDEWDFVQNDYGGGLHSLLVAHVGNISVLPAAVYKVLFHLAGLNHYAIYRLAVIVLHLLGRARVRARGETDPSLSCAARLRTRVVPRRRVGRPAVAVSDRIHALDRRRTRSVGGARRRRTRRRRARDALRGARHREFQPRPRRDRRGGGRARVAAAMATWMDRAGAGGDLPPVVPRLRRKPGDQERADQRPGLRRRFSRGRLRRSVRARTRLGTPTGRCGRGAARARAVSTALRIAPTGRSARERSRAVDDHRGRALDDLCTRNEQIRVYGSGPDRAGGRRADPHGGDSGAGLTDGKRRRGGRRGHRTDRVARRVRWAARDLAGAQGRAGRSRSGRALHAPDLSPRSPASTPDRGRFIPA